MLAAILEPGAPERLYTGLSLLVSAASDGRQARGLVTFGALPVLLADSFEAPAWVVEPDAFTRTLRELRDAAVSLPDARLWACAAAVQAVGADWAAVSERLTGVLSTPQFLREVEGAQLVVV
jgi:peroxiredoxin family protein